MTPRPGSGQRGYGRDRRCGGEGRLGRSGPPSGAVRGCFAVLAASSVAGLLGLTLLTSANQGFLAGCAATHCAHLAVTPGR